MSPWLSWRLDSTSLYPLQFTCLQYSRYHDIVVALACAQSLQLCPALCNHMDCSPPGSSVHRILLARIVEWVAMPSSRGYSQPTDWTQVFCIFLIAGEFFTTEPLGKPNDFSFRSVQVSRSIMSDSLWSHGLQHAMLPCPSPTPRACSDSCPLSQWCHPTISSSAVPFFSCLQSFPASEFFLMSQFFSSGCQSIELQLQHQSFQIIFRVYFLRIDWFDLLAVQGTLKSLLQHHSSKASILQCTTFFMVQLSHPYMTTGKTIALTIQTFIGKVMSLLFNMLSSFVIAFLPRSKCVFISWLQSPFIVILEPRL